VAQLGREYNGATVAVERNNHGHAVLEDLRHEKYEHVYERDRAQGWLTTAASRPGMIENLAQVLVHAPTLFHSPLFLNECRTFVRHADGNAAAAAGTHDDCVMAMAIAFAVRKEIAGKVSRRDVELASLSTNYEGSTKYEVSLRSSE